MANATRAGTNCAVPKEMGTDRFRRPLAVPDAQRTRGLERVELLDEILDSFVVGAPDLGRRNRPRRAIEELRAEYRLSSFEMSFEAWPELDVAKRSAARENEPVSNAATNMRSQSSLSMPTPSPSGRAKARPSALLDDRRRRGEGAGA